MDSLRKLPEGAGYIAQSGQANVKVTHQRATEKEPERVYVYATCDSLELQCERYEKSIKSLKQQITALEQNQTIEKNPPNVYITALKWFSFGLITATILIVIIVIKRKKYE